MESKDKRQRIVPPNWLGDLAKEKYSAIAKSFAKLDQTQLDMVAMMAESYETYLQSSAELAKHTEETGSMTVAGSTGQPQVHPAFKIQTQATANYLKVAQQLRISLGKEIEKNPEAISKLNSILGEDD